MSSRREFLQRSLVLAGVLPVTETYANSMIEKNEMIKITILHTNDMHSHIEPFAKNHRRYAGKGGMQNRFNLISKIRDESPNTLLFDCGDIFQGTPYFNKFGGELELKLMSKMGYDAATMGNHDFDNGLKGFLSVKKYANFPFICSNYDFSDTILRDKTIPYKIFHKSGLKIGVFGIGIKLEGLVDKKLYDKTIYQDPIISAQKQVEILRENHQCDLVICLSHLGYKYEEKKVSDRVLATQTSGIDLILGGHTHTFMKNAEKIKNKKGEIVLVNQVGWAGVNLGKVDFYFEKRSKKRIVLHSKSASYLEIK